MTTIAAKDGTMAADTGMVRSDVMLAGADKLRVITHPMYGEMLVGFSGTFDLIHLATEALAESRPLEIPAHCQDDSITALGMDRHGELYLWTKDYFHTPGIPQGRCAAIGSGQQFALGAMAAGATASAAVEVAGQYDPWTSKNYQSIKFGKSHEFSSLVRPDLD